MNTAESPTTSSSTTQQPYTDPRTGQRFATEAIAESLGFGPSSLESSGYTSPSAPSMNAQQQIQPPNSALMQQITQLPYYIRSQDIGDTRTQQLISQGYNPLQALSTQIREAASTPGLRDDRYYENELQKATMSVYAGEAGYHALGQRSGLPMAPNPFEYIGDLAIGLLKGTQGKSGAQVMTPVDLSVLGLPSGKGLQDVAFDRALGRNTASYEQFIPAINVISRAMSTGEMGPYGELKTYSSAVNRELTLPEQQLIGYTAGMTAQRLGIGWDIRPDLLVSPSDVKSVAKEIGYGRQVDPLSIKLPEPFKSTYIQEPALSNMPQEPDTNLTTKRYSSDLEYAFSQTPLGAYIMGGDVEKARSSGIFSQISTIERSPLGVITPAGEAQAFGKVALVGAGLVALALGTKESRSYGYETQLQQSIVPVGNIIETPITYGQKYAKLWNDIPYSTQPLGTTYTGQEITPQERALIEVYPGTQPLVEIISGERTLIEAIPKKFESELPAKIRDLTEIITTPTRNALDNQNKLVEDYASKLRQEYDRRNTEINRDVYDTGFGFPPVTPTKEPTRNINENPLNFPTNTPYQTPYQVPYKTPYQTPYEVPNPTEPGRPSRSPDIDIKIPTGWLPNLSGMGGGGAAGYGRRGSRRFVEFFPVGLDISTFGGKSPGYDFGRPPLTYLPKSNPFKSKAIKKRRKNK